MAASIRSRSAVSAVSAVAVVVAAAALVAMPAQPAAAQNALGSGDVLDNNLSATQGRSNRPVNQPDFRSRNLLITNNVVGGRGFRGSVGYTAEADFRGDLGFTEFDRFRAESAWSSVNLMNFSDTYQQIRFGEEMGIVEFRNTGWGYTAGQAAGSMPSADEQRLRSRLQLDQISFSSSMELASRSGFEPSQIGSLRDEEGTPYLVTASNLFGLQSKPINQAPGLVGLSTYDFIRAREDAMLGRIGASVGTQWDSSYETAFLGESAEASEGAADPYGRSVGNRDARVPSGRVGGPEETRLAQQQPAGAERILGTFRETDFDRIQDRVARTYEDLLLEQSEEVEGEAAAEDRDIFMDEEMLQSLDERLTELRDRLLGRNQAAMGMRDRDAAAAEGADDDGRPRSPAERERDRNRGRFDVPDEVEDDPTTPFDEAEAGGDPRTDIRVFARILKHGERIEELATEDQTRFNELMREGEDHLRQGEYFWAERYFNRALRFTPGHPLATAGLIHAQIGAGLYTSSALALRSLFSYQPEMIDATYDEGLVPNSIRLREALGTLRTRLDEPTDRAETGLLYAYIGRLLNDQAAVKRGLEVMREAEPQGELAKLLEAMWLPASSENPASGNASGGGAANSGEAATSDTDSAGEADSGGEG